MLRCLSMKKAVGRAMSHLNLSVDVLNMKHCVKYAVMFAVFLRIREINCELIRSNRDTGFLRNNCSNTEVDTRFKVFADSGKAQIRLPCISLYYGICYRNSFESHHNVALTSHVFCRGLGYMTYSSFSESKIQVIETLNLQPNSFTCLGHEQTLSQCKWKENMSMCNTLLTVTCSSCNKEIEATEGFVTSPGYPHSYFFTVLCEWTIIVPKDHEIVLTFRHFHFPQNELTPTSCEGDKPYLEVIYGEDDSLSMKRLCTFNEVEIFKINYYRARLRFYSGIFSPDYQESRVKYGFNIFFQAEDVSGISPRTLRVVSGSVGFAIFLLIIALCYVCTKYDLKMAFLMFWNKPPAPPQRYVRCCPTKQQNGSQPLFSRYAEESANKNMVQPSCKAIGIPMREHRDSDKENNPPSSTGTYAFSPVVTPCTVPILASPKTYKVDRRSKLRTVLLSKFSSPSVNDSGNSGNSRSGDKSYTKIPIDFEIYHNFLSSPGAEESFDSTPKDNILCTSVRHRNTSLNNSVEMCNARPPGITPTIVIEYVDDVRSTPESQVHIDMNDGKRIP